MKHFCYIYNETTYVIAIIKNNIDDCIVLKFTDSWISYQASAL